MAENAASKALEPFARLAERIKIDIARAGLRLVGFSVSPGAPGEPPRVRLACVLDDEAAPATDPDTDAALKGMLLATEEQERAERREKDRERLGELGNLLRDPSKGILGDE